MISNEHKEQTPMTVLEAFAAHLDELLEGDVPDPLRQPFTLAAIWADLARITGEPVPPEVAAILDGPAVARQRNDAARAWAPTR
jgi:NAD-dependent oxidoreductase involved in siderophore biosynthesis